MYDAADPQNLVPKWSSVVGNLLINNYHGCWPLCHDDGSNHWNNIGNVIVWGGQKSTLAIPFRVVPILFCPEGSEAQRCMLSGNMGHDLKFADNFYIHPEVTNGHTNNLAIAGVSWPRKCQLCAGAGPPESETGNRSALCGTEEFVGNTCITTAVRDYCCCASMQIP